MERVYESGAVAGAPAAPAAPSTGYPSAGNPGLGVEATKPGPYWFHMITEEIRAVIAAAGITPDHAVLNQLLLALQGGFGLGKSLGAQGYIVLPGGVIIQWLTSNASTSGVLSTWPIAFPSAVAVILATTNCNNSVDLQNNGYVGVEAVGLSQFRLWSATGAPSTGVIAVGY